MLDAAKNPAELQKKNAELNARLRLAEQQILLLRQRLAMTDALTRENERLRALEPLNEQLKSELEHAKGELDELQGQLAKFSEKTVLLQEEVAWFKSQMHGRSSEKSSAEVSPDQSILFNEPEVIAAIAEAIEADEQAPVEIKAHKRCKKRGKKAIPAHFPRIELEPLDIPEAERICPHDGAQLEVIGAEQSLRYHFTKPALKVLVQKRLKRACPCCHNGVKIAPVPPALLPKSMASPSLLAHITTTKFVDGVPLTRQSQQFERLGLNLGSATMSLWMNRIGADKVPPLISLLHEGAMAEGVLHCDETSLQVLKGGKPVTSEHYMVARAAGPPGRRIILFNYIKNRNAAALKEVLTGPDGPYSGKLVADGLKLYDYIGEDPSFRFDLFGCMAHARRGFDKAKKVSGTQSATSLARVALKDFIGKLYHIEDQIKSQREGYERVGKQWSLQHTHTIRQEQSAALMNAFKEWLDTVAPGVAPKSAIGKAIGYCLNQWDKLVKFLDHPEVPIDNNRVENAIRPFALGRRVWLFCDTVKGAQASANLYSLVGTCRANGIEPHAYLTHLYTELPKATTVEHLDALLPWNVTKQQLLDAVKEPIPYEPTPSTEPATAPVRG